MESETCGETLWGNLVKVISQIDAVEVNEEEFDESARNFIVQLTTMEVLSRCLSLDDTNNNRTNFGFLHNKIVVLDFEVNRRYEGSVGMKYPLNRFKTDMHPANSYVDWKRSGNLRKQTALNILNGRLGNIKEKAMEAFEFVENYFENAGFESSNLKPYLKIILDSVDGMIKHCANEE